VRENELLAQKEKLIELKADFDVQKSSLKDEFQSLSEKILKERADDLTAGSKVTIGAVLKPLQAEITGFKKRVEDVHTESTKGRGELQQQLATLREMNDSLTERADNLAKALRNDKKAQGTWGEIQVEKLFETAGFDHTLYSREENHRNDEGSNQRPDFILHLPQDKALIIDSKVSLNAYMDSVSAETEEERLVFLKAHVRNVRTHIEELSDKDYSSLPRLRTPDFVFLFMPIESAYIAALEYDSELFEIAYSKRIAIVTPTTLFPILRTVESLWRLERQNRSTEELAKSAEKVHKKLGIFLEKFDAVGKRIDTLQTAFGFAQTTLTSGSGNLVRTVAGFKELGVKTIKEFPDSMRTLPGLDFDEDSGVETIQPERTKSEGDDENPLLNMV